MTEFSFSLSREDTDRLFIIKDSQGKDGMTANEFAQELLERELHRLFPPAPRYDEDGELLNGDAYQG
jgi:hypothetical protein